MSSAGYAYTATVPRGFADLLAGELQALGAGAVRARNAAVLFSGPLELGYRACLWSRIASRVLLQLAEFDAPSADDFYRHVRALDWTVHIDPARTIACEFTGTHPGITNSHYGALRLKDAVCDQLREVCGARPAVELSRPAVRLHAHAHGSRITLWLDLAGEGLHRRGYRVESTGAPLRENLAAGLLLRARWPEAAAQGAEFLDPMCGSGTLVIEAAMIAAGHAPGLARDYFGFLGWRQHDEALWQTLRGAAQSQTRQPTGLIRGRDIDARAIRIAAANAERAGVAAIVRYESGPVLEARPAGAGAGLLCTNPPYGERLGDEAQVNAVYAELGAVLRAHFAGWDAAILSASPASARALQLRTYRVHELHNGAIPCRLLRVDLSAPGAKHVEEQRQLQTEAAAASAGAQMFANRLSKNRKRLGRLAQREGVSCYRLYDADMPEYAFAVDRYVDAASGAQHLHVQEYAPPDSIGIEAARRRRREALASLPPALDVPAERIHLRLRQRQSGAEQYRRRATAAVSNPVERGFPVEEGGLKFLVNLDDYLDTGLFLDHRLTRARVRELARDATVLNLFCYTGTATVYAASGGARRTLSVDLSNPYLDWAAANFRINGLDSNQHRLERADCLEWLRAADAVTRYELIFLDPPTFSNSKRMQGVLDIQRDHAELIDQCMRLLADEGVLLFSTNAQRFRLHEEVEQRWRVKDISAQTLPFDFARHPRIHRCFEVRRPESGLR